MSVFETKYTDNMDEKAAIDIVDEAIQVAFCSYSVFVSFVCHAVIYPFALISMFGKAGIWNDLGSGGNVDVCVISKSKVNPVTPVCDNSIS